MSADPAASSTDERPRVSADALLESIREIVFELHPNMRGRVNVSMDSALDRDLGLDSLARMELLVRIEQSFRTSLPEDVMARAETPRDVLHALLAGSARAAPAASLEIRDAHLAEVEVPEQARTLVEALDWHVRAHPDRAHVHLYGDADEPQVLTYGGLMSEARAVAAGLRAGELEPGQNVAIMLPTGVEYLASFIGVLLAGGVPVPIYPPARISQIEDHFRRHARILENALVNTLVTFPEVKPLSRLLGSQVESLRRVVTVPELSSHGLVEAVAQPAPDAIAFLQYTSGSTGDPKGVVLTHADLLASLRAMGEALEAKSTDVFVSWLPLYHDMGLIGAWLGSMVYGCPLVLMSPLAFLARPSRWLRALHTHRGTISGGPNFAYELCLRRIDDEELRGVDLSSWRLAFNGAEPVSPETIDAFTRRFSAYGFDANAMTPVYGLAEATLGVAFTPVGRGARVDRVQRDVMMGEGRAEPASGDDEHALAFVSSGVPIPGFEVRIVDDTGHEAPERREGGVEFRGPCTTSGYYRNAQATRELFHDQWLDSGDRGYVAAGELYITGRSKDVIIRAGRNVYPYDLEQAIAEIEGVRRGCVAAFGARESASGTERLVVVAETRETEPQAREAIRRRVEAITLEQLGMPADETVIASPGTVLKTSSGKIRRAALADLYERGALEQGRRAVWLQLLRLACAGIVPWWRRRWRRVRETAFALWAWLVFVPLVGVAWTAGVALPGVERRWRAVRAVGKTLLRLTATSVETSGLRHVPRKGAFVLVANHSSYLDGLVLVATMPVRLAFVVKRELEGNFLAALFLRRIGCSFVERFERARSVEDAREVAALLEQGTPLGFFPEGTFHRMPGLLPFHLGAFAAAVRADVPVLPVTIRGTRSILRGDSLFPYRGQIRVQAIAPVSPGETDVAQGASDWDRAIALRDHARAEMLRLCGEPDLAGRRGLSW